MKEYATLKMTTNHKHNTEFLNKKASEGWRLITVVPIVKNVGEEPTLHAYMERDKPEPSGGQLITE